jgi:uncharacterized membrane protein YccC
MAQPGWREVLFALKTFGAAMLALYIAFVFDLEHSSWAMMTSFIVSQPIAGMVIAKSLFRVVGTIVGSTVSVILVGAFAQAGELFLLALALWIGACTFVAVLLRDAPASYGAVLSGYTAAIVGIPVALAPETAFTSAVERSLEVLLGIRCGSLVAQLVFPQTAGTALQRSVEATLAAMARWAGDTLRGERELGRGLGDRRTLVSDVIALDALRVYASFDTPRIAAASDVVRHLQGRLLAMLAILASIHDRVALLRPAKRARVGRRRRSRRRSRRACRFTGHFTFTGDVAGGMLRLDEPAPSPARYRDMVLAMFAGAISTTAVVATSAFWLLAD